MKDLVDYIKYHGYITSIRDNVDIETLSEANDALKAKSSFHGSLA